MTIDALAEETIVDKASRTAAAARSVLDRQNAIETLLVRYERFSETVAALRGHHWPLAEGTYRRGTIRGILGPSRAGKSWAMKSYLKSLGPVADNPRVPRALYIDAVKGWSSLNLAQHLLRQLALPVRTRGGVLTLLDKVRDNIAHLGVELVVIDDAQFLLLSRMGKTIDDTVGFITSLAEMNVCNVVLAGTPEVEVAITGHAHAVNRGSFPVHKVEPYNWHIDEDRTDFEFLLMKIDERLPFKAYANLAAPKTAAHFFRISDGLIGKVMDYVKDAAILAMNDNADRIETDHLVASAAMRRRPGDPFEPFRSAIDLDDPNGERRRLEEDLLHAGAPRPTLSKSKSKKPFA